MLAASACQRSPVAINTASTSFVNVGAGGQELAHVAVGGAVLVAVLGIDDSFDILARRFLGVADGDELHVGFRQHPVQIARAAAADAHAAHYDAFAGWHRAVAAQRRRGDQAGQGDGAAGQRGALQESAAIQAGRLVGRGCQRFRPRENADSRGNGWQ